MVESLDGFMYGESIVPFFNSDAELLQYEKKQPVV